MASRPTGRRSTRSCTTHSSRAYVDGESPPRRFFRWSCSRRSRSDTNSPDQRFAVEPRRAGGIEALDFGTLERRHVALDGIADPRLQVSEVTVTLRELDQHGRIDLQRRGRIDRIHSVLFVDRLAKNDAPFFLPTLEEIGEATRADDVACY